MAVGTPIWVRGMEFRVVKNDENGVLMVPVNAKK